MKKITSLELRNKYLNYFASHQHAIIKSSSIIPENDPTVLFTTAGMHPLVPYLLGEKHPLGNRLTDVQKCIRTSDIDQVGDNCHLTFFEMLGNWSLGDYFKAESIKMSYEFLTSKEYLGINSNRLYFTCFAGNKEAPKDEVTYNIWRSLGVPESHLFYLPEKDNFWILGSGLGPCGPDTEIFYDTGQPKCSPRCNPACSCGKYLEIWNNVFMEYKADSTGKLTKLNQPKVDTGMGLERTVAVLNGFNSVYEIDLFVKAKAKLEELTQSKVNLETKSLRIILDHVRTATFILGDNHGIVPSNIGAGYVLRKLIRRSIRHLKKINLEVATLGTLAAIYIDAYRNIYPELEANKLFILTELEKEAIKFKKTLRDGERLFYKVIRNLKGDTISGADAFKLFDTFGFPLEMTEDLAHENNLKVDRRGFQLKFKEHQVKSRTIDAGTFKGGLADSSYETTKYHTLAHLLLASLKEMYGADTIQKGCNITRVRLRFDFNLDHKMSVDEKEILTQKVNAKIKSNTPVIMQEMTYKAALKEGAEGTFKDKYGQKVKVYTIGNFSKEICGGPHVKNTGELGTFEIIKEESSSAGVRRLKAILK